MGFTDHNIRLDRIFAALGLDSGPHRFFVELGFPAVAGSNTEALYRLGWQGVRFDGKCPGNAADNCQTAWITASNIKHLFSNVSVPHGVDYVSIDLDSTDIWVLRALLSGDCAFRPKVISVEYNSNFPWEYALAFPDEFHEVARQELRHWDRRC